MHAYPSTITMPMVPMIESRPGMSMSSVAPMVLEDPARLDNEGGGIAIKHNPDDVDNTIRQLKELGL